MAARGRSKAKRRGPGRLSAAETAGLEARLLDAAEAVFIKEGYARATFDAIARAANVTRKTIYARYPNMEAVFSAVIQRLETQSPPVPPDLPAEALADPRGFLLGVANRLIEVAETPHAAGIGRLMFAETYRSRELQRILEGLHQRMLLELQRILEPLKAMGYLPLMPRPIVAASVLLEMILSIPRNRAIFGLPQPREDTAEQTAAAVDIFLRGCGFGSSAA